MPFFKINSSFEIIRTFRLYFLMPKILIAPLDWGLGHATRCIPIIHCFIAEGWDITLAADGLSGQLLQKTFPDLPLLSLPGYHIRYGSKNLPFQIIKQIPSIYSKINLEQQWLKKQMLQQKWDIILSDNRPGLYHNKAYNIYMTHQLQIHSGLGEIADGIASKLHRQFIKKFDEIWIPDVEKPHRLAGKLSINQLQKKSVGYIGLLSRMENMPITERKYNLMLLLSGPEPQRTILENILLDQINDENGKLILIRGSNRPLQRASMPRNIEVIDLADTQTVNQKMQESEHIICRSGYTTLMDLMKMKKKALLIPTPGQGEQEYLADHAVSHNYFPVMQQNKIDLNKAVTIMLNYNYAFPFIEADFQHYKNLIQQLKNKIA